MGKPKRKQGVQGADSKAVMDLRMDSSTPESPREVQPPAGDGFQTPCTLTGVMAGLSGGSLGYMFGFGGYWVRMRRGGQWKASLAEGWGSAKTFAIMGGLYAAVNCFMLRLRRKQDAWNGAASGCATGLALGWKQGPLSALQSCAMLGAFSFFVDGVGPPAQAAPAAAAGGSGSPGTPSGGSSLDGGGGGGGQQLQRSAVELLLSPAIPLLAGLAPCAFGAGGDGGSGGCSGTAGCRVLLRR